MLTYLEVDCNNIMLGKTVNRTDERMPSFLPVPMKWCKLNEKYRSFAKILDKAPTLPQHRMGGQGDERAASNRWPSRKHWIEGLPRYLTRSLSCGKPWRVYWKSFE